MPPCRPGVKGAGLSVPLRPHVPLKLRIAYGTGDSILVMLGTLMVFWSIVWLVMFAGSLAADVLVVIWGMFDFSFRSSVISNAGSSLLVVLIVMVVGTISQAITDYYLTSMSLLYVLAGMVLMALVGLARLAITWRLGGGLHPRRPGPGVSWFTM